MPDRQQDLVRFFKTLVSRPIAILMGVLALVGLGLIAAQRIPIELQPSGFASERIWVNAPWIGANPQEIETRVVRPLEEELRTIRGVQEMLAFASESSGGVVISFPGSMDMDQAYAEVADRVERVRPKLPRDVDRLFIRRWTTADMPIMWCGVLYPPEEGEAAQDTLSELLKLRLESVDGVANVDMHGIEPRSVRIWLDESAVEANNVDIGALVARLQQDNVSVPVGDLNESGSRFIVRVDGRFDDLAEIEEFPVRPGLKIKDIGRVVMARSAPEELFRVNREYGVGIAITKESSANTFEVCSRLQRYIEEEIPQDPILGTFDYKVFWNSGEAIEASLSNLVEDAALGGVIACLVLMLFLRRLRFTLLIALSIPFSVLATLVYLYFDGQSFNLFTMMGITISIGMLVDNSVVIVESIFKRREQGQPLEEAVTEGPAEVMLAVVTATLTSVVVFLPLIFMSESRNARIFTTSIGVPLCVSLLSALVLAVIIVPVAAKNLVRGAGHADRGFLARLLPAWKPKGRLAALAPATFFPRLAGWTLRHRFLALMLAVLFMQSGMIAGAGNQVESNLAGFGGEMEVDFDFSANTTLAAAETEVIAMEEVLFGDLHEEIGGPDIGVDFGRRRGEINFWYEVEPSPAEEERYMELLEERLPKRAAVEYKFDEKFDRQNTEDKEWTRVVVEGPDTAVVTAIAEEVRAAARLSGDFDKVAEEEDPNREVLLSLDREQMQRLGIASQRVLGTVEWALRGFMVSRYQTGRSDIPIIIEFDEAENPTRQRLFQMSVAEFQSGASLPLGTVADFEHRRGPRSIFRQNGKTTDVVGLKPKEKDLQRGALAVQRLMRGIEMPEGYRWRQAGGWNEFQDDMGELKSAFLLAVALVFFLMGLLFESLLLPFSVLLTIPFAVAGANWAFRASGTPMDIIGMIGMIVLAGVVVNNGIVLLDKILRLRKEGLPREEAIVQGVADRVRPVLMTALTTICGLLPIALSTPDGNGFSFKGLAIGVAGGLACTTFFTLWVVPLAYSLFDDLGVKLRAAFARRPAAAKEAAKEAAGRLRPLPSAPER